MSGLFIRALVDKGISFSAPAARVLFPGKISENHTPDEKTRLVAGEVVACAEYPQWNYEEMDLMQRRAEVRDFLQKFGLAKNEDYFIDPSVRSVRMGFDWDKGFAVDASVAMFDDGMRVVDTVWYRKPKSTCDCVWHPGDSLTDVRQGDKITISVDLANLPPRVQHLLFTVSTFSHDVSFSQIQSACVRMMPGNEEFKGLELLHLSLADMRGQMMLAGVLTRKDRCWSFRTLGIPQTEQTVRELLRNPRNLECLHDIPSYNPELRYVTARVIRGTGLAAKDASRFFRMVSFPNPYFIITFKNKHCTSEPRLQTLAPEWNGPSFQLGWIYEVEMKAMKVQILDYDVSGKDDFMGMVRIPGHALYRLGLGDHAFWFELSSSRKKTHKCGTVSGRLLIQFRIEGMQQNIAPKHHSSTHSMHDLKQRTVDLGKRRKPEHLARLPLGSRVKVDIEEAEGLVLEDSSDRRRSLAIPLVRGETSVSSLTDSEKSAADNVKVEVVRNSDMFPGKTRTRTAAAETSTVKEACFVSTHRKSIRWSQTPDTTLRRRGDPCTLEIDASPEQSPERESSQTTSDEDCTSSSDAGMWIPDEPYGSRNRLLMAVRGLKSGQDFADDYMIGIAKFAGRPHLRLAKQKFGKKESVVLKFYWEETTMENAIEMHSKITKSEYVCRIVQSLKTTKTGHPPCLAFEKGTQTLRDWLLGNRTMSDRTWCLCQILTGLRDLHAEGIVHCDVKPSKVAFFTEGVTWKLINLDGAQKAGESRAVSFTAHYAPPEVLRSWKEEGEPPVAQKASDIWSYGILAYEVLTGVRMFSDELTHNEIYASVLEGRVQERLELIANVSHREAVSKFLKLDPVERWSAVDALQHTAFHSDPQTTTV